MDYAGAAEAYTAALAVDPAHRHVNKQLQLGLCKVQQQLGKAEEAVQVSQGRSRECVRGFEWVVGCRCGFHQRVCIHQRQRTFFLLQTTMVVDCVVLPCLGASPHHTPWLLTLCPCRALPQQACQAALAIEPEWYEAAKQLVRALIAAKRVDEAAVKARELLQQNQQDGEAHQVCTWAGVLHTRTHTQSCVAVGGCMFEFLCLGHVSCEGTCVADLHDAGVPYSTAVCSSPLCAACCLVRCCPVPQLYAEAEKAQKMAKRKDYYKILAVDPSASARDIKSVSTHAAALLTCLW